MLLFFSLNDNFCSFFRKDLPKNFRVLDTLFLQTAISSQPAPMGPSFGNGGVEADSFSPLPLRRALSQTGREELTLTDRSEGIEEVPLSAPFSINRVM